MPFWSLSAQVSSRESCKCPLARGCVRGRVLGPRPPLLSYGFNTECMATHRLLRCAATPSGRAATRSAWQPRPLGRVATRSAWQLRPLGRVATYIYMFITSPRGNPQDM